MLKFYNNPARIPSNANQQNVTKAPAACCPEFVGQGEQGTEPKRCIKLTGLHDASVCSVQSPTVARLTFHHEHNPTISNHQVTHEKRFMILLKM